MKIFITLIVAVAAVLGLSVAHGHDSHTISPQAHTNVNGDTKVNVIDLNQTSTCRNTDPCTGQNLLDVDHNYNGIKDTIDLMLVTQCYSDTIGTAPCQNYTYRDLIFDRSGLHDGCLSLDPDRGVYIEGNTPPEYDWAYGARMGAAPEGDKLTPWYQVTIDHCISGSYDATPDIPSGTVKITDFRSYAYANGSWTSMGSGATTSQWGNYTLGFRGSCTDDWAASSITDGVEFTPGDDPVCIAHGWTWPRGTRPSGYVCALVVVTVDAPEGFLVNVGMDDYNGDSWIRDIGIGRFRYNGKTGWSSCSGTILRSNAPPI